MTLLPARRKFSAFSASLWADAPWCAYVSKIAFALESRSSARPSDHRHDFRHWIIQPLKQVDIPIGIRFAERTILTIFFQSSCCHSFTEFHFSFALESLASASSHFLIGRDSPFIGDRAQKSPFYIMMVYAVRLLHFYLHRHLHTTSSLWLWFALVGCHRCHRRRQLGAEFYYSFISHLPRSLLFLLLFFRRSANVNMRPQWRKRVAFAVGWATR